MEQKGGGNTDPRKLVGKNGNEFILNLLQNPPEPKLGILENVERFQKEYLKLPHLKSFSFEKFNELSNEHLRMPISNILTPLFESLKNEILHPSRTGDQDSIDIALTKIQPFSLLPQIQPIFFTLLKRFNNPAKYYHVLERSGEMLSKCPQDVLIRIWRSEDTAFRNLVLGKLRTYSERFEDEKRRMIIKNYNNDHNEEPRHKEEVLYDLLQSIRNDRILIQRIYDILRSLFTTNESGSSNVNKSSISHFFLDILVEVKSHPIGFSKLKPILKIATRDEGILYQSTTSEIYQFMKELRRLIVIFRSSPSFSIDLQMLSLVSKNTMIQILVNYCLINNPLSVGTILNPLDNNNNNSKCFFIHEKNPQQQKLVMKFYHPNQQVSPSDDNNMNEKEQKERVKQNNDLETWYIITTIFDHLLMITEKTDQILSFFQSLQKLVNYVQNEKNIAEEEIEGLIKNDILKVTFVDNNNNNMLLMGIQQLIFFHISLFLIVDRKIEEFTKLVWDHRVLLPFLSSLFFSGEYGQRRKYEDGHLDIIINLMYQINVEVCRILKLESSAEWFDVHFVREYTTQFLMMNPYLIKRGRNNNKMTDEEEGGDRHTSDEKMELLGHFFLDILNEYRERKRRRGDDDVMTEEDKFVDSVLQKIGEDGADVCKKMI